MQRYSALLLVLAYVIVFLNTSAAVASGVPKVTVTHVTGAEAEAEHHHHESPCPKPHQPHSHEVAIGGHAAHTTTEFTVPRISALASQTLFSMTHERAPRAPSLYGIFRPPIA